MLGLGAVVDAEPGVHVEEVQGTRVDGDLDGLTLAHLGLRVETAHKLRGGALVPGMSLEVVGRFNAQTQVREGQTIEIAVDTRALHFFDADTGLGIYDGAETRDSAQGEAVAVGGSPSKEDEDDETAKAPSA